MPTYEFACETCSKQVDLVFPIRTAPCLGDYAGQACPACSALTLRRIVKTPPVIADAALAASQKYPYVSRQHSGSKLGTERETPEGHAIISSRQEEREIIARSEGALYRE